MSKCSDCLDKRLKMLSDLLDSVFSASLQFESGDVEKASATLEGLNGRLAKYRTEAESRDGKIEKESEL